MESLPALPVAKMHEGLEVPAQAFAMMGAINDAGCHEMAETVI
jgi:hypothetical protein